MRGRGILIKNDYELLITPKREAGGKIVSGLATGNTLHQNTALILICHKGEFKEIPALGVGIEDVLLDDDYLDWRRRIRINLELDDQKVSDVLFSSVDKLKIDSSY